MARFTITVDARLEPIMPRFIQIRQAELARMDDAMTDGDSETLQLLGHRLKGSGASYGMPELTDMGAAIEAAARSGDLEPIGQWLDDIRNYLNNVNIVYQEGVGL